MRRGFVFAAMLAAAITAIQERPAAQLQRNPGVSQVCGTFSIDLNLFIGSITIAELNDEAWAYVDPAQKRRFATGVAEGVKVAAIDSFSNHDSHDLDFHLVLDPGQDDLMSIQDGNYIGVEWETGIRSNESTGDGAVPTFPKWMWPSEGDRIWVDGNWIFDCGHPGNNGLYKTEIHPPRAMAVMRDQAGPLPGTGVTPVPITKTDLYISGLGGFTPNQLNCGPHITLGDHGSTCGQSPPPADDSYKTTPINDVDYVFNVCLPPRPAGAVFSHSVSTGPRNTVHTIAPQVQAVAAAGACATADGFDHDRMAQVTVKMKGTATPPESVYARHIAAGWVMPPAEPFPLRRLTVRSTNLFEDHDLDPGDGELSFWWVNLNRADSPWLRLSDFANGDMNDYDDETTVGDGEMSYTNATLDFYLRPGQSFDFRSRGYEQDCYDTIGAYGVHAFDLLLYALCNVDFPNHGAADDIGKADAAYGADFSGDDTIHGGGDYDMRIRVDHLPLGFEDTSYLSMHLACAPTAEVALVGSPLVCSSRVDNAGPGLPRSVQVKTEFGAGPPSASATAAAWSVSGPFGNGDHPCTVSGTDSTCDAVVVPVAAATPAIVRTTGVPSAPGILTVRAGVATISNDPDLSDNSATTTIEVFQPITIDVLPRDATNVINLQRGGAVSVAILSTATFDAASVDPSSICFGDGNAAAERSCQETHGAGHREDVNRDGWRDLLLHFDTDATNIDVADTSACLTGRTASGTGFFGCDAVAPRQPPQ